MILERDYTHVMIDLETFGTGVDAPVFALGAAVVGQTDPCYTFYNLMRPVGVPDLSTVGWWLEQAMANPKAAEQAVAAIKHGQDPVTVLTNFREWVRSISQDYPVMVWGNGAAFDEPILSNLMCMLGTQVPWSFRNSRCYRTVKAQFGHLIEMPADSGVAHNALDDARYQAEVLLRIDQKVKTAKFK